jgi:hypothetical protein
MWFQVGLVEMSLRPFGGIDISAVSEALGIAEEKTGDSYKFSFAQWKRHHYDVRTLPVLRDDEIASHAFALLKKCSKDTSDFESGSKRRDFYFICLQDHQVIRALRRDKELRLLPLLVYIFTHELVHIVRFCNFSQRFDICGDRREKEEGIVHSTTFEILEDLPLPGIDYILDAYQSHRAFDLAVQ